MARQTLNRGTVANDGTGDTLRTAAQKINENFEELYLSVGGDSATATVTLTDAGVVFEGQVNDDFETTLCAVEPTADRIVYVPNDGGTLILDSCQQTLTNKTILSPSLTTPSIKDADSSHSYNLVVSNLSANRNITLPLLTSSDTFVFANHTQTLNNKTINGLIVSNPEFGGLNGGSLIFDSAGGEYLKFVSTASAVNFATITNSATGTGPTIDVDGDDTNISLNLASKGTGGVVIKNKLVLEKGTDVASSTAVDLTEPLTVFNSGSLISPTIANGAIQGETKYFSNINTGEVRLTPAGASTNIFGVDSGNGFISFDQGDGCQLVWNTTESKWFVVSQNGITTG
jgi:hypothetical protein